MAAVRILHVGKEGMETNLADPLTKYYDGNNTRSYFHFKNTEANFGKGIYKSPGLWATDTVVRLVV